MADAKVFKKGAEDNLSASSSFISNVHNDIYALYMKKAPFWQKCEPMGGAVPTSPLPSNPPLLCTNYDRYRSSLFITSSIDRNTSGWNSSQSRLFWGISLRLQYGGAHKRVIEGHDRGGQILGIFSFKWYILVYSWQNFWLYSDQIHHNIIFRHNFAVVGGGEKNYPWVGPWSWE